MTQSSPTAHVVELSNSCGDARSSTPYCVQPFLKAGQIYSRFPPNTSNDAPGG